MNDYRLSTEQSVFHILYVLSFDVQKKTPTHTDFELCIKWMIYHLYSQCKKLAINNYDSNDDNNNNNSISINYKFLLFMVNNNYD